MKKIISTILIAILVIGYSSAQRVVQIEGERLFADHLTFNSATKSTHDTLLPPSATLPCAATNDSLTILTLNASEWIFGCNSYGDKEAAQIYDIGSDSINIDKVICFVQKMGTTGNIYAKIYSVNPVTGAPSTLLGTSLPKANSSIPQNPMYAQIVDVIFGQAVTVTGKFAVSIEFFYDLPNGSAMGLASSRHGCTVNSDKNSWLKDASNDWFSSQEYTTAGNPLLADVYILPIGTVMTTNIEDVALASKIEIYPSPARDYVDVSFELENNQQSEFSLLNLKGVFIQRSNIVNGKNRIDISSLSPGLYIYQISSNGSIVKNGKLVVIN